MKLRPYVVRQGDHLSGLSHRLGFDAAAIWAEGANDELRRRRPNPDMLAPGDVVHVPDAPARGLSLSPHTANTYRATVPRIEARVAVLQDGRPLANEAFHVEGAPPSVPREGTTNDRGEIVLQLPVSLREVVVRFERLALAVPVLVGHLDPPHERSGMRQRLSHLGHHGILRLAPGGAREADDEADRAALQRFQRASDLEITGLFDDATRDALERAHGS